MKPTIGIITSRGGHLYQMHELAPWWRRYDRFWVTFPGEDTTSLLAGERVYRGYYPESRSVINAVRNFFLAWRILRHERPKLLISSGAGIAPPFFYVGKLLGIMTVFIEPYDFVAYPSLSGRLVSPIADVMLVQHRRQKKFYRNALYKGAILAYPAAI